MSYTVHVAVFFSHLDVGGKSCAGAAGVGDVRRARNVDPARNYKYFHEEVSLVDALLKNSIMSRGLAKTANF